MTTTLGEYPGCRKIFFTSAVGDRLPVLAENNVQAEKSFLEAMGKNPFTSAVGDRLSVLAENNLKPEKLFWKLRRNILYFGGQRSIVTISKKQRSTPNVFFRN